MISFWKPYQVIINQCISHYNLIKENKSMKYKGIELKEITTSQIFDQPKKMITWDSECGGFYICEVLAIVNGKDNNYPVIAKNASYRHCAEIPEEHKPRRVTNRELSKWLAKGHGEYTNTLCCSTSYITYEYFLDSAESEVSENILVRKWDDIDWHEPTVDYIGIE